MSDEDAEKNGFIVEYYQLPGNSSVKVTAIDPQTGREVSLICPEKAGRKNMAQLAIRKLRYVMRKK